MNGGTDLKVFDSLVDELEGGEMTLRAAQAHRPACIETLMDAAGGNHSTVSAEAAECEVATLLHVSTRTAARMCDEAALTCGRPAILAALAAGHIDLTRAKLIALLLGTEDLQELFECDALLYAAAHTTHEVRRWLLSRLPDAGDVTCLPLSATWTTWSPGQRVRPPTKTSTAFADAITGSNIRPAGRWSIWATTSWSGPVRRAGRTGPDHRMPSGMRRDADLLLLD